MVKTVFWDSTSIKGEPKVKLRLPIYISRKEELCDEVVKLLLLLLLSRFSRVWFRTTLETAAYQAPRSLGFSRQEHWRTMGCHFLLQCMKVESESEVTQSCPTLRDPMYCTRLLRPWDFPGKSAGVGCHCLLRVVTHTKKINTVCWTLAVLKITLWCNSKSSLEAGSWRGEPITQTDFRNSRNSI